MPLDIVHFFKPPAFPIYTSLAMIKSACKIAENDVYLFQADQSTQTPKIPTPLNQENLRLKKNILRIIESSYKFESLNLTLADIEIQPSYSNGLKLISISLQPSDLVYSDNLLEFLETRIGVHYDFKISIYSPKN